VWNILAATYATPSRGCIKQVNANLKLLTKGTLSIIDFLQLVKAIADELAVLGALVDNEDLTDKILEELGDDYQELVRAVQARENAFSFDELYEKLLMFEASLQETNKLVNCFPPTTHPTNHTSGRYPFTNVGHSTPKNSGGNWRYSVDQQRCYPRQNQFVASHNITNSKKNPSFHLVPLNNDQSYSPTLWQPQANLAVTNPPNRSPWLLDSGASHHITLDLQNLAHHLPYVGTDDVMIRDGKGLHITHLGSTKLHSSTHSFNLHNILCVPDIKHNLLFVYQFCVDNNVSIEFLPWCFLVKDLLTGKIRAKGKTKEGVYD